ncbi:MAG: hypothetical protein RIB63_02860 [Fulvivirga sp.]
MISSLGISIISLADTIGVSNDENITYLYTNLIKAYPHVEFGAHLHSNPATALDKIKSAYKAGCKRFDGAIRGFGGCPMAKDDLTGNIATELIVSYLQGQGLDLEINQLEMDNSIIASGAIFDHYH